MNEIFMLIEAITVLEDRLQQVRGRKLRKVGAR